MKGSIPLDNFCSGLRGSSVPARMIPTAIGGCRGTKSNSQYSELLLFNDQCDR